MIVEATMKLVVDEVVDLDDEDGNDLISEWG